MKTMLFAAVALALAAMASASAQQTTPTDTTPATGAVVLTDAQGNRVTVRSHLPEPPARDHRAAFGALDTDADGGVSRREAQADKYLLRAFAVLDGDGNGRLDYQEALAWLDD